MTAFALRVSACVPCRVRRLALLSLVVVLNVVHPIIHGTPLDGGVLDQALAWANSYALAATTDPEEGP